MEQFKIACVQMQNILKVAFTGKMNEYANLTDLPVSPEITAVEFDFDHLIFINSVGIHRWLLWMQKLKAKKANLLVKFIKCPKIIIDQVNGVNGFLPSGGSVESLYIPYHSSRSGRTKSVLVTTNVHFGQDTSGSYWIKLPKPAQDPADKNEDYEPDIIVDKYFQFLKKKP